MPDRDRVPNRIFGLQPPAATSCRAPWNAATSAWDRVGGPLEFGSLDAFGNLPMIRDVGGEPHVPFVNAALRIVECSRNQPEKDEADA